MIHVYPINDLKEHLIEGATCACNPDVDCSGAEIMVVHHSYDGREAVEHANKILGDPISGEDGKPWKGEYE